MSTTTRTADYVRHDGAADYGPDDRVRWNLTARQQEICEAVVRLTVADALAGSPAAHAAGYPGAVARDAADRLALLRAHAYARRYVVLSGSSLSGRWPEYTAEQREEMAAGGMTTGRPAPLYFDTGHVLHDYIDAVMAATGAAEEAVWEAVGLRPYNRFGREGRQLMRTRAEAAADWAKPSFEDARRGKRS